MSHDKDNGRKTHICGINGEGHNVSTRKGLDCGLVLRSVAHDKDDEAASLHIKSQRLGQRQARRPRDNDNLGAAAILASLGPPYLSHVLVLLVALVGNGGGDDDGSANQVLVPREPALQLFDRRQRHDNDLGLGRGQRLHDVGQPVDRRQPLANSLGGLVDALVDELGGIVRDLAKGARDGVELEGICISRGYKALPQGRGMRAAVLTTSITWLFSVAMMMGF